MGRVHGRERNFNMHAQGLGHDWTDNIEVNEDVLSLIRGLYTPERTQVPFAGTGCECDRYTMTYQAGILCGAQSCKDAQKAWRLQNEWGSYFRIAYNPNYMGGSWTITETDFNPRTDLNDNPAAGRVHAFVRDGRKDLVPPAGGWVSARPEETPSCHLKYESTGADYTNTVEARITLGNGQLPNH